MESKTPYGAMKIEASIEEDDVRGKFVSFSAKRATVAKDELEEIDKGEPLQKLFFQARIAEQAECYHEMTKIVLPLL
jgi:hypothetical protein